MADWFYKIDDQEKGPVTGAALKQLADRDYLKPFSLVRRQDMTDWVQASSVKGLFANPQTPPPQRQPPPRREEPEEPAKPSSWAWNREGHPFDFLLNMAREALPADLPQKIASVAGLVGVATLYLPAVLAPIVGLLLAIRTNRFGILAGALGVGVVILVAQFIAQRLLGAVDAAITANKSVLASSAIPDCYCVVVVTLTVGGVLALLWGSIADGMWSLAIAAIGVLVVGGFSAIASLQPEGLGCVIEPKCRAAEDAVGVFTFLIKIILRIAPLGFAAAVVFGTYRVAALILSILRAPSETVPFVMMSEGGLALGILAAGAAVPLYAYLLLILYFLTLDIISAIVSIPAKLDVIANGGTKREE